MVARFVHWRVGKGEVLIQCEHVFLLLVLKKHVGKVLVPVYCAVAVVIHLKQNTELF